MDSLHRKEGDYLKIKARGTVHSHRKQTTFRCRGSENMDCSHSAMYHQKAEPQDVEGSHMSTVSRRMSTLT